MKRIGLVAVLLALLAILPAFGEETELTFQDAFSAPANAQEIDLGEVKVEDIADLIAYLKQFPDLKKVDMFATPINAANMERLEQAFPGVEFGWTMMIRCFNPDRPNEKGHFIRTDATVYSTLHSGKCVGHTSKDFSILRYCKNMVALDLGHNALTDLDFLYSMPHLRVLILAINEITDPTPVTSLKDLEYLEIFSNQITDLSGFENLTNLMDLNLCFNKIQDYSPLYQLPRLNRLWLYRSNSYNANTSVPDEVLRYFKENRPEVTINYKYYPTLMEWRTYEDQANIRKNRVPHYAVIYDMFNTGVYIPFEESAPLE